MLKLILFIFINTLLSKTCADLKFNNLRDKMDLELLKLMPGQNVISSAMMMRFALCKLASVADGEALNELKTALGYNNDKDILDCYKSVKKTIKQFEKADLTHVNTIYVKYTNDIDPTFIANSENNFGVQVAKVGFNYPQAAIQFINRYIATATYRRITDVFDDQDINKNTTMVIVNAINFKVGWVFPFNIARTKAHNFYLPNGQVSRVMMMRKFKVFFYVDAGEFQAVVVDLLPDFTSITFILPASKTSLPNLVSKAHRDPDYMKPFLDRLAPKLMLVLIPRFDIKTYVDWTGFLQEMGLYAIFNCTSPDLLGILKEDVQNSTICLNKAKSKIFFQLDEMGAYRNVHSSSRGGIYNDIGPEVDEGGDQMVLALDRPFMFTVNIDVMSKNRQVLLTGTYYGPEKEQK